ncbi:glutathione S-transferase family protein [Arenibaculum sp.]|uniref:glutathione S-transferase family protein n=1 Tax=Arenibaculum sp. TaxID=2865862 RepID=UPI002E10ACB0|nr:glutathione S-transferase family protein [Arenibaculum sp.]
MFVLHHDWDSLQSWKVRLCLAEKGIAWEGRQLELRQFEHLRPEYLAVNPDGVVPTLVHGETVVWESSVINEYLDEVVPEPALVPKDPAARARMRQWVKRQDDVVHPAVRALTFNLMISGRIDPEAQVRRRLDGHPLPERAAAYRDALDGRVDEGAVLAALRRLHRLADRMEDALREGAWLAGAAISLADVAMAPLIPRLERLALDPVLLDRPGVAGWVARLKRRDAYAAAHPDAAHQLPSLDPARAAGLLEAARSSGPIGSGPAAAPRGRG